MIQEYELSCVQRISTMIDQLRPDSDIMAKAQDSLEEITPLLGFGHYMYVGGRLLAGHKIMGWQHLDRPITIANINPEFRGIYSQKRLDRDDLILKHSFHVTFPYTWTHVYEQRPISAKEQKFLQLSYDFDMKDGLSFPVHGPGNDYGILSFSSLNASPMTTSTLMALITLFAQRLHASIRQVYDTKTPNNQANLTAREVDILHWCCEGKTAWEIGEILGISSRTVETYIDSAKRKLGAVNTTQAIAKAMTVRFRELL